MGRAGPLELRAVGLPDSLSCREDAVERQSAPTHGSVVEWTMLKDLGKSLLRHVGLAVSRIQPAGTTNRPTARTVSVLEDFRARGFVPQLIFDVGASDGAWTRLMRPVFPEAISILVEPRPVMLPGLDVQRLADPRCFVVAAAVGSNEGTATLTDWDTGSTLLPVAPDGAAQMSVPVVTLHSLALKFGTPDLVKLDIEGFELEALSAAGELIGATELFIIEVALLRFGERPMLHEVVAFMASRGYVVYDIGDPIRRPFDGALSLLDVCFARQDGHLRRSDGAWHRVER